MAGLGFNPSAVPTGAAQPRPLRCCRALRSSLRAGTFRCGARSLHSSAGGGALGRRIGRPCPQNTSCPAAPVLTALRSSSDLPRRGGRGKGSRAMRRPIRSPRAPRRRAWSAAAVHSWKLISHGCGAPGEPTLQGRAWDGERPATESRTETRAPRGSSTGRGRGRSFRPPGHGGTGRPCPRTLSPADLSRKLLVGSRAGCGRGACGRRRRRPPGRVPSRAGRIRRAPRWPPRRGSP